MMAAPPKSVLVYVGLDRIGDGLLKLPFVYGLRRIFPKARLTWLAGKETSVYAGVMAGAVDGLLDEVIEYGNVGLRPSELLHRPLAGRGFDLVIDTQRIFWVSLSLYRIPHKTFISPAANFLLSSRKPPPGYRRPKSMQRQMLDLLELAGDRPVPDPKGFDLAPDPAAEKDAVALLPPGLPYVGIAPGSGGKPKCWPLERFISIAKEQVALGRRPVFILGPQETDWLGPLGRAVPEALFPLQEKGIAKAHGFSPQFTIALSKQFTVCLANDSGVGHMFALGGRPLVSLFGPTVAEKFMPMTKDLTLIRASDYGSKEMDAIPVEAVSAALKKILNR